MAFPVLPERTVKAILVTVAATALALICVFPQETGAGVWNGYRILAVFSNECESEVVSLLEAAGIDGYACESNSLLRADGSLAPYQPELATLNAGRSRWFSDGQARFFYLPAESVRGMALVKALETLKTPWTLERRERTFAYAYISLAFALACLILSKNRSFSFASSIPFVALARSIGELPGFTAALLSLSTVCILADLLSMPLPLLSRRQVMARLRANPAYAGMSLLSGAVALSGGAHVFLLFLLAFAASVSFAALSPYLYAATRKATNARRLHPRFEPVPIHPARMYRTNGPERSTVFSVASLFAVALVAGLAFHSFATPKSRDESLKRLSIPAPTGYTDIRGFSVKSYLKHVEGRSARDAESALPDLADYVAARWRIAAFPWTPIHSEIADPAEGGTFGRTEYSQDSRGSLVSKEGVVGVFDDAFVRGTLKDHATPLERMLEKQGRFTYVTRARQDR